MLSLLLDNRMRPEPDTLNTRGTNLGKRIDFVKESSSSPKPTPDNATNEWTAYSWRMKGL
jgi:hypothetical protein